MAWRAVAERVMRPPVLPLLPRRCRVGAEQHVVLSKMPASA